MDEQEYPLIHISLDDVTEANRLSLHCPICANPVENGVVDSALTPVICTGCHTLYHKACWQQSGGKCAILGCDQKKYVVYGQENLPVLKIKYTDLPRPSLNGRPHRTRTKQLKEQQRRQVEQLRRPSLLQRLWQWLLDQIKIG